MTNVCSLTWVLEVISFFITQPVFYGHFLHSRVFLIDIGEPLTAEYSSLQFGRDVFDSQFKPSSHTPLNVPSEVSQCLSLHQRAL